MRIFFYFDFSVSSVTWEGQKSLAVRSDQVTDGPLFVAGDAGGALRKAQSLE